MSVEKKSKIKEKSLTFAIFKSTFLLGSLVYFLCAIMFISNLYNYFEQQIFNELENEATFIEDFILNHQYDEIRNFDTKNRITLIHKNGEVFFDNKVDIQNLGNHFTREEILGALKNKQAKVARFSSTMTEKTLYYAKLLSNQDILRISCNQHSVAVLVLGMSQSLLIMFVIAIIICAVIAKFVSKKIVEPLNKINLENPEDTNVYQELKPFTHRISEENFEKAQREELRQQFSANVSHELKTPLTSISGFAEILKNGGTDEQTTKDFANTIYEETQRMISLVNDIIKLSKLDEKSISQEKEEINLTELSKEVITPLLPVAEKKNVKIDLEAENQVFINGVRSVIFEMIYNLVENAIKYNKNDGKVIVKVSKISENPSSKKQTVVLSVSDTGIGIPKNEQERIFERFYRIDKSRSKESGGTGLGLSIVKHGAKYHNAKVTLSSQEGKGSTFTIYFEDND
ncbi:MAG: ATP-binding protein [Treponema sp.]|nr:ATP-binding protein [Spirochaetales bacterium]MDY6190365.1 ATP-binding protein [Treponema sp.]